MSHHTSAPSPAPGPTPPETAPRGGAVRRAVLSAVGIVVAFALAGLGAGWLWEKVTPTTPGAVVDGKWYAGVSLDGTTVDFDLPALRDGFGATAHYVIIGVVVALVLGLLVSLLLRGPELVILGAVLLGALLAAFVSYRLGVHLGPPDPDTLAAGAADGTVLSDGLRVPGRAPFVAWPVGALLGLGFVYLLTAGVEESQRRELDDPDWLGRQADVPPTKPR